MVKKHHHKIIAAQACIILGLVIAFGAMALGGGPRSADAAVVKSQSVRIRQVSVPSGIEGVATVCAENAVTNKIITCTASAVIPSPGK